MTTDAAASVTKNEAPAVAKTNVRMPLMDFLSLVPTTSSPYTPKQAVLPESRLGFLTLAPTVSSSYPRNRHPSISHLTRPLPLTHGSVEEQAGARPATPTRSLSMVSETKSRRSSSMSSDTSGKARLRFLKLGPVHWGEHLGDHKEDWAEADEEPPVPNASGA